MAVTREGQWSYHEAKTVEEWGPDRGKRGGSEVGQETWETGKPR